MTKQFLEPAKAVIRIDGFVTRLGNKLRIIDQYPYYVPGIYTPAQSFLLAIMAQGRVINYLNDDLLNCPVPWESELDLPSLPSLALFAARVATAEPATIPPNPAVVANVPKPAAAPTMLAARSDKERVRFGVKTPMMT